jgi:hypothetical protein
MVVLLAHHLGIEPSANQRSLLFGPLQGLVRVEGLTGIEPVTVQVIKLETLPLSYRPSS